MNTKLEKYQEAFEEAFGVSRERLNADFTNEAVEEWDSIGHMNLISLLEEAFDIFFEGDDILALSSYEIGKGILAKYDIEL